MSWMCLWPISRNALPSIKERAEKGGKERDNRNEDRHFLLLPLLPSLSSFFQLAGMAWRDLAFRPPPPAWPRERMWATASYNNAHGSRRGRGCTAPLVVLVLVFAAEMSFPFGLLSVSVSYHFQTREESLECDPT